MAWETHVVGDVALASHICARIRTSALIAVEVDAAEGDESAELAVHVVDGAGVPERCQWRSRERREELLPQT